MELKPGNRLTSVVCDTEVIVVKAPVGDLDLRCGGLAMIVKGGGAAQGGALDPGFADGTLIGKRYADAEVGLELLCTKAGAGSLSVGTAPVTVKDAKPLPSSD